MTVKPQVKHVIGIVEIGEKSKQNWKSLDMKAKGRAVPDGKKEKRKEKINILSFTSKKILLWSTFKDFFKKIPTWKLPYAISKKILNLRESVLCVFVCVFLSIPGK